VKPHPLGGRRSEMIYTAHGRLSAPCGRGRQEGGAARAPLHASGAVTPRPPPAYRAAPPRPARKEERREATRSGKRENAPTRKPRQGEERGERGGGGSDKENVRPPQRGKHGHATPTPPLPSPPQSLYRTCQPSLPRNYAHSQSRATQIRPLSHARAFKTNQHHKSLISQIHSPDLLSKRASEINHSPPRDSSLGGRSLIK
jgi:hypothetical protein